jgi:deoxyribodipyrimidine photo-lyase
LVVRRGKPEDVLEELWREGGWTRLHYHRRVGTEEAEVEQRVESMCGVLGIATQSFWDLTLLDLDEMPFTIDSVPEVYTNFRKAVERVGGFTEPVPAPRAIQMPQQPLEPGDIPTAGELGVGSFEADERAVLAFAGGERAGQQRLADYFWERDKLKRYKDTRNGMVGADYSSKLLAVAGTRMPVRALDPERGRALRARARAATSRRTG